MDVTSYILGKKSGGGSGTPKSMEDVNTNLHEFDLYISSFPNDYSSLTEDTCVLYTPDIDYNQYILSKSSTNSFRIYWLKEGEKVVRLTDNILHPQTYFYDGELNQLLLNKKSTKVYSSTKMFQGIENAINAIKSNETAYTLNTSVTNINDYHSNEYPKTCTNMAMVQNGDNPYIEGIKVSSKETIEGVSN